EIDRDSLQNFLEDYFKKEYPEERAEKEEKILRILGLWNTDKKLNFLRKEILYNQVVAFYDEGESKGIYYISFKKGPFESLNSIVIAHELRHAIQDQHLKIRDLFGSLSDFDDRKIAVLSILEGDATLIMLLFAGIDPSTFISFSEKFPFSSVALTHQTREIPLILKNLFVFPYILGLKTIYNFFKAGGMESVNKLVLNPPKSTEKVIHPEKIEVMEEPFGPLNFYIPEGGWKLKESLVCGEFFISSFFENFGIDPNKTASEGWGNDVLSLWERGDKFLIHWSSIWDSKEDAIEFHDALEEYLKKIGSKISEIRKFSLFFSEQGMHGFMEISKNRVEFFKSNDKIFIRSIFKESKN
ncbi:MAG: hypothetical protein ACUVUG_06050, partial [Candidatus Aminicenantia bacterium]